MPYKQSTLQTSTQKLRKLTTTGRATYTIARVYGPREAEKYVFIDALHQAGISKMAIGPVRFHRARGYWLVCIEEAAMETLMALQTEVENLSMREIPPKLDEIQEVKVLAEEFLTAQIRNYAARSFCQKLLTAL